MSGYFDKLENCDNEVVLLATLRILKVFSRLNCLSWEDKENVGMLCDSIRKKLGSKYKFL